MNDLKFAFRQLLKNPGFTAVTVLMLALGIGATAAVWQETQETRTPDDCLDNGERFRHRMKATPLIASKQLTNQLRQRDNL